KTMIVTGDKDMYQLVGDSTVILDYLTGKESGADAVKDKFGVTANQIKDYLALTGDSSDGIPGVQGIGPKTAAKLLNQFKNLEAIYDGITAISSEKLKASIMAGREQAFLSRELATLHFDVPFDLSIDGLKAKEPDIIALSALFKELGFTKLLNELRHSAKHVDSEDKTAIETSVITAQNDADAFFSGLAPRERLAVYFIAGDEPVLGEIDGAVIGLGITKAFYVQIKGSSVGPSFIERLLSSKDIIKDTDNAKAIFAFALKSGFEARGMGIDISIASYLLNPSKPGHNLETLSFELLGSVEDNRPKDLFENINNAKTVDKSIYVNACNINKIAELLKAELEKSGLDKLYYEMELPLAMVLSSMELAGIKINSVALTELSKEMELVLSSTEDAIYLSAGDKFNISSPKQLSELLFQKLKLKPVKKTKTGFSTDEEVLSLLSLSHELPGLILNFRQLAKLKSTYVDAFIELQNPSTGRIHTSFNQTVTATGRLSSSRPNLQNIPVRGAYAERIRGAFVPERGFEFFSADYSQIELRIMAHVSKDQVLTDAFLKNEDIHARTAKEVFGIATGAEVTPEMRRKAKAINFGIIYGMGAYGLAAELDISQKEASDYIDSYFAHYTGVKRFMDATIAEATACGYTTTLFGRRRFVPELKSQTDSIVRFGQRVAINTPIQGTAADIIKVAMINIYRKLKELKTKSKMLLQIHDELLFEVAVDEKDMVTTLVKIEMESVIALAVPISVNTKSGADWNAVE
ncbi:DNA polymerase I, partial [bacterium]